MLKYLILNAEALGTKMSKDCNQERRSDNVTSERTEV